jgi:hypothetical protein
MFETMEFSDLESPKRGRGRPREFDREQGLVKVMHLFWSRGYDAISMTGLRAGLGITQASLWRIGNRWSAGRASRDHLRQAMDRLRVARDSGVTGTFQKWA